MNEQYQELKQYESNIPKGSVAVPISGGGFAYFRRPSNEEWDELQALAGDEDQKNIAYRRTVSMCFIGAFIPGSGELVLNAVIDLEGPGFITGPAGKAVNMLAGASGKGPPRLL